MRLFLLLLVAVALVGCAKPGITGKWSSGPAANGQVGTTLMDFQPNGRFSMSVEIPNEPKGPDNPMVMAEGTYKQEGENLNLTIEKSPFAEKLRSSLGPSTGKEATSPPRVETLKVVQKDADTLDISGKSDPNGTTFKRTK